MPDYVGFIFAASKRQVSIEQAEELCFYLHPGVRKVGVFVNSEQDQVQEIAAGCSLDVLQFHGNESPQYCMGFKMPVWKVFSVLGPDSLRTVSSYQVDGVLLDSATPGAGRTFDWSRIPATVMSASFVLAGGLNPENVSEAIATINPDVVDVSSGVETQGVKDFWKMKEFIEKVRSYT